MPARLLLFCALLMASASSLGMTIYEITDDGRVTSYSDRPGPGAKTYVRRVPMVEVPEGQVLLNAITFNGGVSFSARNQLHVPVEVELRLDNLVNAQGGNAPRTVRRVLPPRTCLLYTSPSPRDS